MNEEVKKEVWKVFSAASFLFITIFFILPYLVQITTYFHERGHMKAFDKHGVENEYHVNLIETIPNFFSPKSDKLGVTKFSLTQYYTLDKYQRTEIHIAGIISDLRFLFLIAIYLTFVNIYLFYKIRVKQEIDLTLVLAINWILFMWLLALIQITLANISNHAGDIFQLVKFLKIG